MIRLTEIVDTKLIKALRENPMQYQITHTGSGKLKVSLMINNKVSCSRDIRYFSGWFLGMAIKRAKRILRRVNKKCLKA